MYCPQCGSVNDDSIRFCTKCGFNLAEHRRMWTEPAPGATQAESGQPDAGQQAASPAPYPPPAAYPPPYQQQYQPTYQSPPYYQGPAYGTVPNIPSYMAWAIVTLILCFWPTGIVAVVYASKVGNRLALGDIPGAQEASRKAKLWCWITFAIAIALVVIAIVVSVLAAAVAVDTFNTY